MLLDREEENIKPALLALAARGVKYALVSSVGQISFARECTPAAARALGAATVSYGRLPLMLTERCFVKEFFGCDSCGHAALTDRKGVSFPVLREYPHRCLIFNSLPTYLADTGFLDTPISTHMIFSTEAPKEALSVLRAYKMREPLPFPVRRAFK